MADAVRLNVAAIVAANAPAGYAAQRATRTIPIVIPTMSINLKTAKALGLTIPPSVLLRANEVIQ